MRLAKILRECGCELMNHLPRGVQDAQMKFHGVTTAYEGLAREHVSST